MQTQRSLRSLEELSPEELEEILKTLQELESLRQLEEMIEAAKGRMAGESGDALDELESDLDAMLERMRAARAPRPGQGGMGNNPGQGKGGEARHGPDDGREIEGTKVKGRIDRRGNMGRGISFKGVPKHGEAGEEFAEAIKRAAQDAAESLGKDELPPDARPFVRRYFDSLKSGK